MLHYPVKHIYYMSWLRETAILSFLLTLCIFLYAIRSYETDIIYTQTPGYLQTEQKIASFHDDNMRLNDQILSLESYNYIASRAASEGFVPAPLVPLQ